MKFETSSFEYPDFSDVANKISESMGNATRSIKDISESVSNVSKSSTIIAENMSNINIKRYEGNLLDESCRFMIMSQKEYAKKLRYPLGDIRSSI